MGQTEQGAHLHPYRSEQELLFSTSVTLIKSITTGLKPNFDSTLAIDIATIDKLEYIETHLPLSPDYGGEMYSRTTKLAWIRLSDFCARH